MAIFGAGCVIGVDVPARGDFPGLAVLEEEEKEEDEESAVKGREERLKNRSFGFAVDSGCVIAEDDTGADRFRNDKGCEGENVTPPFLLFCPDDFPEVGEEVVE